MERLPENSLPLLDFRVHLDLIRDFTDTYKTNIDEDPAIREIRCLKTMFPGVLFPPGEGDLFTGKCRQPAVCFTPQAGGDQGGFGYSIRDDLIGELMTHREAKSDDIQLLEDIREFWSAENSIAKTRLAYPDRLQKGLPNDNWTRESGIAFPLYRMAGTQLDYYTLVNNGIDGLGDRIEHKLHAADSSGQMAFYSACIQTLELFSWICIWYADLAAMHAFDIDRKEACHLIPFGCGEYILNHRSVDTPSGILNLLKALEVVLHKGYDPLTGEKTGIDSIPDLFDTFDELLEVYERQVKYYIELLALQEDIEYLVAGETAPFLFLSTLYDDCLERGKGIFSGGVRYLGGMLEIYGFTSTADSLTAIRRLVFEENKLTFDQLVGILDADFEGFPRERLALLNAPKYGNNHEEADNMVVYLHNFVCNYTRDQKNKTNLHSYLVVNINNDANTTLGKFTCASADGRKAFSSMSNGNSPSMGRDSSGPTALLNTLVKPDPSIHAGTVQNMKFSKELFNHYRVHLDALLNSYFIRGGTQAMITVVGKDDLENAMKEPEKYTHLIVRVGGFSARFVELSKEVRMEILNRTLY
jgi:hypothetical protein